VVASEIDFNTSNGLTSWVILFYSSRIEVASVVFVD